MISSMNCYLCALAISDMTVIITAFFLFFLENIRRRSLIISKFFAILAPITFPLGLTAQSFSVFLTVTAAIDCFILVSASAACKKYFCTVNRSIQVVIGIFLIAAMYNSPHMFEIFVVDCWSLTYSHQSLDTYLTVYYAWLYTAVMAVGPVISLIILNTAIILSIKHGKKTSQDDSDSDIITLVLVVCLFISCNILPLIVNFLELFFGVTNSYLIDLSNLMVVLNSSCNFLIYYAFGSRFRCTLKQYLFHSKKSFENGSTRLNDLFAPQTEFLI
ncbi:unnamed protein product [Dracunculus medinensis]|uniref:G_PROTEIN_RECEP_F1_2 domain-containing protein n=1 Tax=Dracunculus medinensis TaxID=318479 RepID=A0A0N4UBY0_DRAME|nr:unnamed protein product [Dracunculus medinensis]